MKLTTFEKLPLYLTVFHVFAFLLTNTVASFEAYPEIRIEFVTILFFSISLPLSFLWLIIKNKRLIGLIVISIGFYGFRIFGYIMSGIHVIKMNIDGYTGHTLLSFSKLFTNVLLSAVILFYLFLLLRKVNTYHEKPIKE